MNSLLLVVALAQCPGGNCGGGGYQSYYSQPVYTYSAPTYYAPPPQYYAPPPQYYAPPPVMAAPPRQQVIRQYYNPWTGTYVVRSSWR